MIPPVAVVAPKYVAVTAVPTGPEAGAITQYAVVLDDTTTWAVAELPASSVTVNVYVPAAVNAAATEVVAARLPSEPEFGRVSVLVTAAGPIQLAVNAFVPAKP
jgi:hypothetical protein